MRSGIKMSCVAFICCLVLGQQTGCSSGDTGIVKHQSEVEISPGRWLTVERKSEVYKPEWDARHRPRKDPHKVTFTEAIQQFVDSAPDSKAADTILRLDSAFTFDWNGKNVEWKGKEFPVTLREHEGSLYMVGFNRQDIHKCRFVFSRLRKDGSKFEVIGSTEFPRQIATQNMSINLLHAGRLVRVGDDLVDTWKVLQTLDIQSRYFRISSNLTAAMWYQIETGTEYWKISNSDLTQQFLQDYVAKYKPIALPTIIKAPIAQTTNAISNVTTNK